MQVMLAPFLHHLLRVLWLARPHVGSVPGTLLRSFLPVQLRWTLRSLGTWPLRSWFAFWVAMVVAIMAPWNYTLIRFFTTETTASGIWFLSIK